MARKHDLLSDPQTWVELYGNTLYRYAIARVPHDIAEDIVQDTFLAALKGAEKFSGRSSEKTWLFGILKHKIADHYRKLAKERPLSDMEGEEDFFDSRGRWIEEKRPGKWKQAGDLFEEKEFWGIFEHCYTSLPAQLLKIFDLRELKEFKTEEICKILQISATNLWVSLHRARLRIRHCLEKNWFVVEEDA